MSDTARTYSPSQLTGLLAGPVLLGLLLLLPPPQSLGLEGWRVLAITAWMAAWWLTEAVPIAVTALLPIVLFPLLGLFSIGETTPLYGNKIIYLFLGGFMLAAGLERWNLHERVSLWIIRRVGLSPKRLVLGFMLATGLFSMWLSNTATVLMMLPIALASVRWVQGPGGEKLKVALLLGLAYSASIGGLGTLVGTPTNGIFASVLPELLGQQVSFTQWLVVGLPVAVVLLLFCWFYLTHWAFRLPAGLKKEQAAQKKAMDDKLAALGPISKAEARVLLVFGAVVLLWVLRGPLLGAYVPGLDDSLIAIAGAIALFVVPAGTAGLRLLSWKEAREIQWGILLLFGGGLALAKGWQASGLAAWLGGQLAFLGQAGGFVLILGLTLLVNFVTEITSNIATATMMLPMTAALASGLGLDPLPPMLAITMAASCAFMMPVATAPNAIVFSAEVISIRTMARAGLWLNLVSSVLIALVAYFVLPYAW